MGFSFECMQGSSVTQDGMKVVYQHRDYSHTGLSLNQQHPDIYLTLDYPLRFSRAGNWIEIRALRVKPSEVCGVLRTGRDYRREMDFMQLWAKLAMLAGTYLLGSLPLGYLIVKILTGRDVRREHSGRTGGTNVMRSAGFAAGLVTAVGDMLKGASAVWITKAVAPDVQWMHAAAGLLVILGHNYSIFLIERVNGKLRLRGGAGGGPSVGATMGLWLPSILIIVPLGLIMLFGVGYASLATISVGLLELVIFSLRAMLGIGPWEYAGFGLLALLILLWSLRPNIGRLLRGEERLVGWRAKVGQADERS
jgi:glycerol-3-phosphate acyltransferase PlsY